jgi:hypothetical protein
MEMSIESAVNKIKAVAREGGGRVSDIALEKGRKKLRYVKITFLEK